MRSEEIRTVPVVVEAAVVAAAAAAAAAAAVVCTVRSGRGLQECLPAEGRCGQNKWSGVRSAGVVATEVTGLDLVRVVADGFSSAS